MDRIRVVGFGAMNMDNFFRVGSILADDETAVEEYDRLPGGSAANTIYGLAKLGVSAGFVGAVGDDESGRILLEDFKSVDVDVSHVKIKANAKTGSVLALTDGYGRRALYVSPGANNLFEKEDADLDYLEQSKLIHISSFVGDKQFELQKWVVDNIGGSVKISFAPGAIYVRKGLAAIAPIIRKTDILLVNSREVRQLTGRTFRAGARQLLAMGCRIVVVTLGGGWLHRPPKPIVEQLEFNLGPSVQMFPLHKLSNDIGESVEEEQYTFASYVTDGQNEYIRQSKEGERKDTTGAGDAFATGFLFGLLHRHNLEESSFLGDITAWLSIAKIGARPGLPSLHELSKSYEEYYGRSLSLNAPIH